MPAECSVFTMVLNSLIVPVAEIARHRAQKIRWSCSPSSCAVPFDQMPVVDEVVDRHQFDGRDAERGQIIDHRGGRQAGIGAAQCCVELQDAES